MSADATASALAAGDSAPGSSPSPPQPPRVLSIQSHVVHGWVGNKCATFPLQLMGCEVDPFMSVQFSNHTGYPLVKGAVFDGDALTELVSGLSANGLLRHTHLLTGYIGSLSLLEAVADVAARLRATNPGLVYVCDPVMGDEGRMYVSEALLAAFIDRIVPLADLLVPNQYEAELLTGSPIRTRADAWAAMRQLHALGPRTVVMTSFTEAADPRATGSGSGPTADPPPAVVTLLASTALPQAPGRPPRFALTVPKLDAYFTGTGDLLAALLLGWCHRHPGDLATATEKAVAGLQAVLAATAAACPPELLRSRERTAEVFAARELRVVAQREALLAPTVTVRAEPC